MLSTGLQADGRASAEVEAVRSPWDGRLLAEVPVSTPEQVEAAVARAAAYEPPSPHRRFEILSRCADLLAARAEEFAGRIVAEAGKPIRDARHEVGRSVETIRLCAEEAKRLGGEVVPLASSPGRESSFGFTIAVPAGPVCAIGPFNAPLNTVCHKVPTAVAAGCGVVLKPSERTPLSSLALLEILAEAGLPEGAANLVLGPGESVGEQLLADPRFAAYSFTGSHAVGLHIRRSVGLRKTLLELGNCAACVVHEDADLDRAAAIAARAAFACAGQLCTSTQRLLVHEAVRDTFLERFLAAVAELRLGDPGEEATDVGPMIEEAAAVRAEQTVSLALAEGADLATGGGRDGALFEPTVLLDVEPGMTIAREEVFAPLVGVIGYDTLERACEIVNSTRYGLQSSVFTGSIENAFAFGRRIEMGSLIFNGPSTLRLDQMPFGGVKESGVGREGVPYAIAELTEQRLLAFDLEGPR